MLRRAEYEKRSDGYTAVYRLAAVVAVVCVLAAMLRNGSASADSSLSFASVSVIKLSVRASASPVARSLATLIHGDVVQVTQSKEAYKETWYNVITSGGKTGWCQARYLAMQSDTNAFKPSNNSLLDWPSEYISLSQTFTYQRCMQDMGEIAAAYPELARLETIGTSVMGNPIGAIVIGNPEARTKLLVQASIHARELISSLVALRQAESMLKAASMGANYKNLKISSLLARVEIWIVPMANPDGVRLVYEGLKAVPSTMPGLAASLKAMNRGSTSFYHWKANANGVDLNRNFDASWRPDPKTPKPGLQNYPGRAPFTEPETIALRDLTVSQDFAMTLSYHSSGKMIYWDNPDRAYNDRNLYIAKVFHLLNGYRVLPISVQAPYGGYRDWYVTQYDRPGFTIEFGTGYCPLPLSSFSGIWKGNRFLLLEAARTVALQGLTEHGN